MDVSTDDLSLAAEFPPASREQWLKRVEAVLKGADFEKKLVSRSYDGLRIAPLYDKAQPAPAPGRAAPGRWRIAQRIDHPDPASANALALADLEGGADALVFAHAGAPAARGFGVEVGSVDDLERALAGVMLDLIEVRIEPAPFAGAEATEQWAALVERRKLDPARLALDFGLDPIGDMARSGAAAAAADALGRGLAETVRRLRDAGFAGPFLRVDTRPYHEAGAAEAQELAAALAAGVAYLRALESAGESVETARYALGFLMVADADQFLTIAKLRALRRLWARIEEACGLAPKPLRLHAETAWRMTTRRDPWVNLLRGTIAAFSAGLGGADSVTVLPFTAALGLADGFARRLARNTQAILLEESNLWRVADPAAGSGGLEALTEALAEKAWALFQNIEREGGIVASLRAGALQARIAATRAARGKAIATRREPITGTSEFPDLREAEVKVLMPSPFKGEGGLGRKAEPGEGFPPLPSLRDAELFERLRDRSDAHLAKTGARPKMFLANLGPVAAFTARATFAGNLFEAGGIEAVTNEGFADPAALAAAFRASGADAACLCSSDEVYAAQGPAAARALKQAGCARLLLAGRPGEQERALREAGIDDFVFVGGDVLALLKSFYED